MENQNLKELSDKIFIKLQQQKLNFANQLRS